MNRMRRVPVYFILTLCVFASCGRKSSTIRAPEPSQSPTSSVPTESIVAPSARPSQAPTNDFAEVAQSIRPAVIIVSVFDETGHLSANGVVLDENISGRFSDEAGEWFDATPALPKTSAGAPVIDHRGEVIGIVSFRAGTNSCTIRPAATAGTLLAQVSSNVVATWQTLRTPTASPTATRSPTPAKIPLRGSKLIYAPVPRYPVNAKQLGGGVQGSGSFRVLFDATGHAVAVQTLRSTGNSSLDEAAVSALHEWRSEPGREWSLVVPITFKQ